jgi:xylulokinase
MNQYLILLDIGGTFVKTAKIDLLDKNEQIKFSQSPIINFIDKTGCSREINPVDLLEQCKFEVSKNINSKENIVGIFISGQMGGWILTDEDNKPRTNILSWQDQSVLEYKGKYKDITTYLENELGREWKFNSGNELRPGLPIISVINKLDDLELRGTRIHTLLSFIAANMVTEYEYILSDSDFASTGMLNIFDQRICIPNSLSSLSVPNLSRNTIRIGNLQNTSIPVFTPVGDQQASLHGSGLDSFSIIVNIGTGGQVAKLGTIHDARENQVRPYFDNKLIITKTHLPSGRLIKNFLKNLFGNEPSEIDFNLLKDIEFKKSKNIFEPILNFTEPHIKYLKDNYGNEKSIEIFLASLSKEYENSIQDLGFSQINKLVFAGGVGQKIKYISKFIEDKFSLQVEIAQTQETTLKGLANLGKNYFV